MFAVRQTVPVAVAEQNEVTLDAWAALLAGSAPWVTDDHPTEAWTRFLGLVEVGALVVTAGLFWWPASHHRTLPALAGSIAVLLLALNPLQRAIGHRIRACPYAVSISWRILLLSVAGITIHATLHGFATLLSVTLAVGFGADLALTCNELGWTPTPVEWYRRFLLSAFHFGVLGAVAATVVAGGASRLRFVLPIFVTIHAWAIVALATLWCLNILQREHVAERDDLVRTAIANERRQRAHWIHDDVCAQLRLVSLQVQSDAPDTRQTVELLADFDHQLRLRQLDELLSSGTVRLAEVLQPYIRYAQNKGVHIQSVPGFDQAARELDESTARMTARAINLLTANALAAGATSLSYELGLNDEVIELTICDNGPGFDLADVPHGRGLWSLMTELGPDSIAVHPADGGGSVVTVKVADQRKGRDVTHSPRR